MTSNELSGSEQLLEWIGLRASIAGARDAAIAAIKSGESVRNFHQSVNSSWPLQSTAQGAVGALAAATPNRESCSDQLSEPDGDEMLFGNNLRALLDSFRRKK